MATRKKKRPASTPLARLIERHRLVRGWSHLTHSAHSCVHPQLIQHTEAGRIPTLRTLVNILNPLGLTLSILNVDGTTCYTFHPSDFASSRPSKAGRDDTVS